MWCDAFVSALGCAGCLWPVRGTGLRLVLCCLVVTGLTCQWDRSNRSGAAAFQFFLFVWITYHIASRVYLRCSHTLVAPHWCWDLGGVSFVLNMCNLACEAKCVEFHSLAQIKGELKLNLRIQKHYWISFESFNRLTSITNKREIERASRPLVGFGVLIDNTIKGLTCLREIISRFLICEMI